MAGDEDDHHDDEGEHHEGQDAGEVVDDSDELTRHDEGHHHDEALHLRGYGVMVWSIAGYMMIILLLYRIDSVFKGTTYELPAVWVYFYISKLRIDVIYYCVWLIERFEGTAVLIGIGGAGLDHDEYHLGGAYWAQRRVYGVPDGVLCGDYFGVFDLLVSGVYHSPISLGI